MNNHPDPSVRSLPWRKLTGCVLLAGFAVIVLLGYLHWSKGSSTRDGLVATPDTIVPQPDQTEVERNGDPICFVSKSGLAETPVSDRDNGTHDTEVSARIGTEEGAFNKATDDSGSVQDCLNKLSAEFKSTPISRQEAARKLVPHLLQGMTTEQVTVLLGAPTSRQRDGLMWSYSVFYSQAIVILFDKHKRVDRVDAIGIESK